MDLIRKKQTNFQNLVGNKLFFVLDMEIITHIHVHNYYLSIIDIHIIYLHQLNTTKTK